MNTLATINWTKVHGLIPAIIQDAQTLRVLMLGYMNDEALEKTLKEKKVYFFSRSKQRLWMKGETSGNVLHLQSIHLDCDQDTLLVQVLPQGNTCHTGAETCFHEDETFSIHQLERIIQKRIAENQPQSYTVKLFEEGLPRIAQKVGEEAVETVIAALAEKEKLKEETGDLIYHLLVLLHRSGYTLRQVEQVLAQRHQTTSKTKE